MLYSILYSAFCQLVEGNTASLFGVYTKCRGKMPGYCLSLAVRVGCEEDLVCRLSFRVELADNVSLAADVYIVRFKIVFDIYTERAFGKVADVSDRRRYLVVRAKIALDRVYLKG